ncbi:hypothetical protein GTQ48_07380 [Alteromonas genovensis]|uniref:Uncharacterized protein n=1 Tax=Alteromonas genovensis TaxID=471225 RepID=A0A6N9TDG3_9ALTE|nr:hypothetical protein [Alteromonas genovensis]NDW15337.1 hypothetical protein [Alteromonas genovensis]
MFIVSAIALSGYFYNEKSYKHKYAIKRMTGYLLFYRLLFSGSKFLVAAGFFYFFTVPVLKTLANEESVFGDGQTYGQYLLNIFDSWAPYKLLFITLATFCVSVIYTWLTNLLSIAKIFLSHNINEFFAGVYVKAQKKSGNENDYIKEFKKAKITLKKAKRLLKVHRYKAAEKNEFKLHLFEATLKWNPVLVSLSTGKAYVGYVFADKMESIHAEDDAFSIIPVASGYRDDDQKFKINELHENIATELIDISESDKRGASLNNTPINDPRIQLAESLSESFRVSFPFSSVVSVSYFKISDIKSACKTGV